MFDGYRMNSTGTNVPAELVRYSDGTGSDESQFVRSTKITCSMKTYCASGELHLRLYILINLANSLTPPLFCDRHRQMLDSTSNTKTGANRRYL